MTAIQSEEWTDDPLGRIALWCGPASIGVSAGGILLATVRAPWFSYTGNALSDLGAAGAATALLFNGTLVVTGILGIAFALYLYAVQRDRVRRTGAVVFGLAAVTLALIGVFPLPSPNHAPVAIVFFLLFTVAIAIDGAGSVRRGHRIDGALSVSLAALHVGGWLASRAVELEGIALPEFFGTILLWIWLVRRFIEMRE